MSPATTVSTSPSAVKLAADILASALALVKYKFAPSVKSAVVARTIRASALASVHGLLGSSVISSVLSFTNLPH